MATGPAFETYKELLLFLGTAGVIVPLFARLQMSPVFGFLATGVILGPFILRALAAEVASFAISNVEQIAHLSEFGIAFLLFMIGLELSWERLIQMRRLVFGLGALQVIVSRVGRHCAGTRASLRGSARRRTRDVVDRDRSSVP
jgi:K+:H+ antiporter